MTEDCEHIANGDVSEDIPCDIENEPTLKKIFVQLKSLNNEIESNDHFDAVDEDLKENGIEEIQISSDISCKAFKKLLNSVFQLEDEDIVLKLRNHRGSIIPLSFAIQENCELRPYILEVCKLYENVTPLQRTASLPTYEEVLRRKLQSLDNRVFKLSNQAPCLPEKQQEKVHAAITNLNDRMKLLERKLTDADDTHWQGMFKRNPLW